MHDLIDYSGDTPPQPGGSSTIDSRRIVRLLRTVAPQGFAIMNVTAMESAFSAGCAVSDLLADLNPDQRAAVECVDGPLLVIAGAGSGKTRVLVTRIAYLIDERGIDPSEILAITFTRKAAQEMRERLIRILGRDRAMKVTLGTFHALGVSILREYGSFAGLANRFTVIDEVDVEARVRSIQRALGIVLTGRYKRSHTLAEGVTNAKIALVDHLAKEAASGHLIHDAFSRYRHGSIELWKTLGNNLPLDDAEQFGEIYRLYQETLARDNVVDYSDLICLPVLIFLERPEVHRLVSGRWKYIHIDEYQDTDFVQEHLVRLLSARHGNVCAVGDPAQAIYSWRGARIENIRTFAQRYSPCTVIRLERNYRSTPTILNAANALLQERPELSGLGNILWTDRPDRDPIRVWVSSTQESEAIAVATDIERAQRNAEISRFDDVLILYRRNSLARPIELALQRSGIPYRVTGTLALHERAVIRDLLAFLRFAANPSDAASFERATNAYACGIGPSTIESLNGLARVTGRTLLDIAANADSAMGIRPQQIRALHAFAKLIQDIQQIAENRGVAAALQHTLEVTEIRQRLIKALVRAEQEDDEETTARIQRQLHDIDDFVLYVEEYSRSEILERYYDGPDRDIPLEDFGGTTLHSLLDNIALLQPGDNMDFASQPSDQRGAVTLMTIHAAKGLEASRVYVVGLEEGIFPSCLDDVVETSLDQPLEGSLAEEARLFYVALTRARDHLVLSASRTREIVRGDPRPMIRSRFLASLPETLHRVEVYG